MIQWDIPEWRKEKARSWANKMKLLGEYVNIQISDKEIKLVSLETQRESITIPGCISCIGYASISRNCPNLVEVILEDGVDTMQSGGIVADIEKLKIPSTMKQLTGIGSTKLQSIFSEGSLEIKSSALRYIQTDLDILLLGKIVKIEQFGIVEIHRVNKLDIRYAVLEEYSIVKTRIKELIATYSNFNRYGKDTSKIFESIIDKLVITDKKGMEYASIIYNFVCVKGTKVYYQDKLCNNSIINVSSDRDREIIEELDDTLYMICSNDVKEIYLY